MDNLVHYFGGNKPTLDVMCISIYKESLEELNLTLDSARLGFRRAASVGNALIVVIVDGNGKDIPADRVAGTDAYVEKIATSEVLHQALGWSEQECTDSLPEGNEPFFSRFVPSEEENEPHTLYIVKHRNKGKKDTHDRFFELLRMMSANGVETRSCPLTDAGTLLGDHSIELLVNNLIRDPRLVAVTARQRAIFWSGMMKHITSPELFAIAERSGRLRSLWLWWASPASFQAAEFEQTFMMIMDAFNLVRQLPILPGPLQVFRYADIKKFDVDLK
jgi:hypothetical protein